LTAVRANSISDFSLSVGFIASPAIVTGFIATGAAAMWIVLLCLLVGFSGGSAVRSISRDPRRALDEAADDLAILFGTKRDKLAASTVFREVDWSSDSWARGSYTFDRVGHPGAEPYWLSRSSKRSSLPAKPPRWTRGRVLSMAPSRQE
jgi:hypothetical protein